MGRDQRGWAEINGDGSERARLALTCSKVQVLQVVQVVHVVPEPWTLSTVRVIVTAMKTLLIVVLIAVVALLVLGGLAMRQGKLGGPWANRTERDAYGRDKPQPSEGGGPGLG